MTLIEHYAAVKHAHVALVSISVALFATRGIAVLTGARWPMRAAVRRASVAIDTLLIGAGGTLWWMLSLHPLRERWLLAKLLLIVLYIALGSLALKRAPSLATKALAFAASLACVAAVAVIALTHGAVELWPG
jgi:uncharacterized membrane protein SirB2